MRTTLEIDQKLLREAQTRSQQKTKSATVNEALEAYVRDQRLKELLSLRGKIRIQDNLRDLEEAELERDRRLRARRH